MLFLALMFLRTFRNKEGITNKAFESLRDLFFQLDSIHLSNSSTICHLCSLNSPPNMLYIQSLGNNYHCQGEGTQEIHSIFVCRSNIFIYRWVNKSGIIHHISRNSCWGLKYILQHNPSKCSSHCMNYILKGINSNHSIVEGNLEQETSLKYIVSSRKFVGTLGSSFSN